MRVSGRAFGTFLLIATAAACSGGPGVPEERFCAEYAEAECASLARWCGLSAESCQAARVAACQMRALALRSAARQYDGRAANACLTKLVSVYRSQPIAVADLRALDDICDRVYHGNHQAGEACGRDNDCVRGLVCNRQQCVRARSIPAGEECNRADEICQADSVCTSTGPQSRVCLPRMALGGSCTSNTDRCLETLRCDGQTCVDRLAIGSECDRDDQCALPSGFCSPYTGLCADSISFAPGTFACVSIAGQVTPSDAGRADRAPAVDAGGTAADATAADAADAADPAGDAAGDL